MDLGTVAVYVTVFGVGSGIREIATLGVALFALASPDQLGLIHPVGHAGARLLADVADATGLSGGFGDALAGLRRRQAGHEPRSGRCRTERGPVSRVGAHAVRQPGRLTTGRGVPWWAVGT